MVLRSMPASRSLKLSVPKTNKSGKPAENPKHNMRQDAGSKYTLNAANQLGVFGVDLSVDVVSAG